MTRIDGIVGAHQQLVDVARKVHGAAVFADGGQISRGLAIEQAEFLQIGTRKRLEPAPATLVEQGFEFAPVRFALLQPASRNHGRLVRSTED